MHQGRATITSVYTDDEGACILYFIPDKNNGLPLVESSVGLRGDGVPMRSAFLDECRETKIGEEVNIFWYSSDAPDYVIHFGGFANRGIL